MLPSRQRPLAGPRRLSAPTTCPPRAPAERSMRHRSSPRSSGPSATHEPERTPHASRRSTGRTHRMCRDHRPRRSLHPRAPPGDPRLRYRRRNLRGLTEIKGARDITSGVVPLVAWASAGRTTLGWVLVAAAITPAADALIVLTNGGKLSTALGVHGLEAALLVAAGLGLAVA